MKFRKLVTSLAAVAAATLSSQVLSQEGPGINAPPPAPAALLAPANGMEINGLNANFPAFSFSAVSTATSYQVYIAQTGVGGAVVHQIPVMASNAAQCPDPVAGVCTVNVPNALGLMPDGASYRWWVGSANSFSAPGTFTWSAPSAFNYALEATPPMPLAASDLLLPVGNAPAPTRSNFQWVNKSNASFFRLLVKIQESGFIAGPGKWVSAAAANCLLPGGTGQATCATDYTGHMGTSPFEDYCWTITPWNSKGMAAESAPKCFQNTSQ